MHCHLLVWVSSTVTLDCHVALTSRPAGQHGLWGMQAVQAWVNSNWSPLGTTSEQDSAARTAKLLCTATAQLGQCVL